MKLYAVISRTVEHNTMGIDWIYPNIMTDDYAEAKAKFDEEKANLQKKLSDDNTVIIVQDEDTIFEVSYKNFPMRRYVKIIDLY